MGLLAVFVVTMALWYVLRKLHGKLPCLKNTVDMTFVFLKMSLSFLTKVCPPSLRVLLSSYLLFSLIITCLPEFSVRRIFSPALPPGYRQPSETL
jgi:hypothetical protein